jgi:hypothetical protein
MKELNVSINSPEFPLSGTTGQNDDDFEKFVNEYSKSEPFVESTAEKANEKPEEYDFGAVSSSNFPDAKLSFNELLHKAVNFGVASKFQKTIQGQKFFDCEKYNLEDLIDRNILVVEYVTLKNKFDGESDLVRFYFLDGKEEGEEGKFFTSTISIKEILESDITFPFKAKICKIKIKSHYSYEFGNSDV